MENTVPNVDIAAKTATTPTLHPSVEDLGIEKYIQDAARFLETARLDGGIAERLAGYGFDDEELALGMGLQEAAWQAFVSTHGDRAPDPVGDTTELPERVAEAREEYADYRLVARAAFQGLSDRVNLRVIGDAPDDLQRFINAAYAGYAAAAEEPYAEKLAKRGFPKGKLDALRKELNELATMDAANENVEGSPATEDRDAAYKELREFMKEIKGVSRAAFRKRPEAMAKLGL